MSEKQTMKIESFAARIRRRQVQTILRTGKAEGLHSIFCSEVAAVLLNHMMELYPDREAWKHRENIILSGRFKFSAFAAALVEFGLCEEELIDYQMLETCKEANDFLRTFYCYDETLISSGEILAQLGRQAKASKQASEIYYVYMSAGESNDDEFTDALKYAADEKLDNVVYIMNIEEDKQVDYGMLFEQYHWNVFLAGKGDICGLNEVLYHRSRPADVPTAVLCVEKKQDLLVSIESSLKNTIELQHIISLSKRNLMGNPT